MMIASKQTIRAAAAIVLAALIGGVGQHALAQQSGQAAAPTKPPMVEDVFKNVQALKGISVDDFMLTMGIMSAAVGSDCVGCHPSAGTDHVDWALDTPRKRTARRMVQMVTAHQPRQLRRTAGGDVLDLPSRPRPTSDHADAGHGLRRADARRRRRARPAAQEGRPSIRCSTSTCRRSAALQNVARDHQLRRHGKERRLSRVRRRRRRGDVGAGSRQARHPHHAFPNIRTAASASGPTTAEPAGSPRRWPSSRSTSWAEASATARGWTRSSRSLRRSSRRSPTCASVCRPRSRTRT